MFKKNKDFKEIICFVVFFIATCLVSGLVGYKLHKCNCKVKKEKSINFFQHKLFGKKFSKNETVILKKTKQSIDECVKKTLNADQQKVLDPGNWYRITMQSFNENSITAEGGNGVNRRYGRPYTTVHNCDESDGAPEVTGERKENYNKLWNQDYLFYVDGEEKYDVCTEETVSNTVYYYTPWVDTQNNTREEFSDYYASFFSGTATPRSNHSILVNVFASSCDLGNDPDEWERRGKLVATHKYNQWDSTTKAREQGLVYYAAVVHFAKGESAVSDVYTMYGF